jgi:DNA-binding transcriptional LysR family regulator
MEDHRLKAFCLVVEMKSFSKAAEAKLLTQSAMSHLIRNLEDEVGVRLLNRRGKQVIPTPAGRVFYRHAKRILAQFDQLENDVYTLVREVKGTLHIGANPTVATYLLPQVFYAFLKNYPEAHVELSVHATEEIVNDLLEGKISIGLVDEDIHHPAVYCEEIAKDEIVIIASEDHPLAGKKKISSQDLISQPFIMPKPGSGIRKFIDESFHHLKIDPKEIRVLMTLGSTELIVRMVQSGIGIAFVSKWSAFQAVKEGTVRILNLPGKKLKRKFFLIRAEKEPSSLTVRTFQEFIQGFKFFIPF